jgi:release factor glutamine methyltransferase
MTTLGQAWRSTQQRLESSPLQPAPREGQYLVSFVAGLDISDLSAHEADALSPLQQTHLEELLTRRLSGEPLAYVLGKQPFWSHDWRVEKGVLIPRPDSEILVHQVLAKLPLTKPARVAEVGLGSGALLGSVLLERPLVSGIGTEIDAHTAAIATQNLTEAGVLNRAEVKVIDALTGLEGPFDLIFSNPPYISATDYAALEETVRAWEPEGALLAADDGLAFYKKLLPQAWERLPTGGWLCVEIGYAQGEAISALFNGQGFAEVSLINDLANRPRVVEGRKP